MMDSLLRQLKRMNRSLESAWRSRTEDPEAREGLLRVLMVGDMLERQVHQMLLDELAINVDLVRPHNYIDNGVRLPEFTDELYPRLPRGELEDR